MTKLIYEKETYKIRAAVFEVYNTLGPGFKEQIYHNALADELVRQGLSVESKKRISVQYKGKPVGTYEPDFIVEDKIIIEIKAVEIMPKIFETQLYSYLKGIRFKVGLLINFGSEQVQIKRRVY